MNLNSVDSYNTRMSLIDHIDQTQRINNYLFINHTYESSFSALRTNILFTRRIQLIFVFHGIKNYGFTLWGIPPFNHLLILKSKIPNSSIILNDSNCGSSFSIKQVWSHIWFIHFFNPLPGVGSASVSLKPP